MKTQNKKSPQRDFFEKLKKLKGILVETIDTETGKIKTFYTDKIPNAKLTVGKQQIELEVEVSSVETEDTAILHRLSAETKIIK